MKLLILNWQDRMNPESGGAEVHLHEIFGRLVAKGHSVTLLTSGWAGGKARELVDGIDVHRVGSRHTYLTAAPVYYRRRLGREGFDLVIEDLNKVPLWSPVWSASPVVLMVHHLFGSTAFSAAPLPVALTTWLSERPLALIYGRVQVQVVSRSTGEDLVSRGFDPQRIRVVHNGVDSDFFRPDPMNVRTEVPTLLYLGRLQPYKGVGLIVRALAEMERRGVRARLEIVGKGPEEEALHRLAEDLGVADRVRFVGFVDDERKRALLRTSWINVLASPKEGWGLTVIEAGACGTPTVGSDSPGLRDSILDGDTGILVPHGDWAKLGEALAGLIENRDELERMGTAARHYAESFTWERSAREAEEHLEWCIEMARSP